MLTSQELHDETVSARAGYGLSPGVTFDTVLNATADIILNMVKQARERGENTVVYTLGPYIGIAVPVLPRLLNVLPSSYIHNDDIADLYFCIGRKGQFSIRARDRVLMVQMSGKLIESHYCSATIYDVNADIGGGKVTIGNKQDEVLHFAAFALMHRSRYQFSVTIRVHEKSLHRRNDPEWLRFNTIVELIESLTQFGLRTRLGSFWQSSSKNDGIFDVYEHADIHIAWD